MSFKIKYRPQTFDDLFGAQDAKKLVKALIRANSSSAVLLEGPTGCGKTSFVEIAARAVNCQARDEDSLAPCGKCAGCSLSAYSGFHKYLCDKESILGKKQIDIRNAIYFAATYRKRVLLFDEVHELTPKEQVSLHSHLDHLPKHHIWFATTTDPEVLKEAFRERFMRVSIEAPNVEMIVALLSKICRAEGVNEKNLNLKKIALSGYQNPRRAVNVLEAELLGRGLLKGEYPIKKVKIYNEN